MSDTTLTNRAIAERAGYTVTYHAARGFWRLNAPDGGFAETTSEAKAWGLVPDYLASTDAALTLPLAEMCTFELRVDWKGGATARIFRLDAKHQMDWHWGDTPAEAICAAWWAWKDAEEAR